MSGGLAVLVSKELESDENRGMSVFTAKRSKIFELRSSSGAIGYSRVIKLRACMTTVTVKMM